MRSVEEYLAHAAKCERQAQLSSDIELKKQFVLLADGYRRLAKDRQALLARGSVSSSREAQSRPTNQVAVRQKQ